MRVYLSGPITGVKDYEERFARAEAYYREMRHEVVNPVKVGKQLEGRLGLNDVTWRQYMEEDIKALVGCDVIALLPGYEESQGATTELMLAEGIGILPTPVPASLFDGMGGAA